MFDPFQMLYVANQRPIDCYNDQLDEEHYAQRYGSVVGGPILWSRFSLWLGKLLIRIGERLTGECRPIELSRETA